MAPAALIVNCTKAPPPPDFSVEPGDEVTNAKAPIGYCPVLQARSKPICYCEAANSSQSRRCWQSRPRTVNAPFDRKANGLDVSLIPQEWIEAAGGKEAVPVITHCGGGGRGQKAKDYLESQAHRRYAPAYLGG